MEVIKSRGFKIAAITVGVLVLMLASFAAGISVGFRKMRFSNDFGKNYERNFLGYGSGVMGGRNIQGGGLPGQGMMGGRGGKAGARGGLPVQGMMGKMFDQFEGRGFRNAHGLAGTIISIAENNLVIKDRDNKENTVAVSDKTLIKNGREDWKIGDLKTGDQVVVMGSPNEGGVIDAVLVRVFVSVQ